MSSFSGAKRKLKCWNERADPGCGRLGFSDLEHFKLGELGDGRQEYIEKYLCHHGNARIYGTWCICMLNNRTKHRLVVGSRKNIEHSREIH